MVIVVVEGVRYESVKEEVDKSESVRVKDNQESVREEEETRKTDEVVHDQYNHLLYLMEKCSFQGGSVQFSHYVPFVYFSLSSSFRQVYHTLQEHVLNQYHQHHPFHQAMNSVCSLTNREASPIQTNQLISL